MIYGPDIVRKVTEELQKVPTIRQACKNLGIDHSTFYRWMAKHYQFHQEVEASKLIGRERMSDAAESVIMTGIQNGDFRAAAYWLAHNCDRYVGGERARYFLHLQKEVLNFLREETPENSVDFVHLFQHYFLLEKVLGEDEAKLHMEPLVKFHCQTDPNLVDVFYASYTEWRKGKRQDRKIRGELLIPPKEIRELLDSPDPSVIYREDEDTDGGTDRDSSDSAA